jgi:MFS family permease
VRHRDRATLVTGKYRVLGLMTGAQAGASVIQQSLGVLAPFLIADYGLNNAAFGAVFTSMFIGSTCFTAVSGALTDQIGERRMVLYSGLIMGVALISAAAWQNYVWLMGSMFVFGSGYAAATPAGGRAVLAWFDRDRGFAMGIRQTGVPLGGLAGALLLPFIALHVGGYRAALAVAALLVIVPAVVVFVAYRESGAERPPPSRKRDIARGMAELALDPRLIAVTIPCILLVNVQLALNGFLTITAIQTLHVTPAAASLAFAGAFAAATSARLFWGWFTDRVMRDRIALLAVLCVFASASTLAMALLRPASVGWLVPVALVLGFTGAGWNGVMAAALAEIGGANRAGSALGLTLTGIFAASAVGPLVFGSIADHHSLATAWIATSIVTLVGVVPPIWLRLSSSRSPRAA